MTSNGYTCPWCPVSVIVAPTEDAARVAMERHLDGHMLLGLPTTQSLSEAA